MPVKSSCIIAIFLLIQTISTSQQDESGSHGINSQKKMSGSYNLLSRNIEGETATEESIHQNTDVHKNIGNNNLNVIHIKKNGQLEALDETSSTGYLRSRRSATPYGRKGRSQQAYYSQVNLLPGKEIGNNAKYGYSTKEREQISLAATKDNNKYNQFSVAEMNAGGFSKREVEINHPHLYSEKNNNQDPHHHFQFHRSVRYANFPPTNIQQQDGHSPQRKRQVQSKYDFQTYPNNLQTNEIEWSSPLSYPISTNSSYGIASQNIPYPYQQYPDSRPIYNHNYFNQHQYPKQSMYNYQPDYHTQPNNFIYSPLSSKQPYKYQSIPFAASSTGASISPTQNIPIMTMKNPVHKNSAHLHSGLPFPQNNAFENSFVKIEPSHNEFGEWTEELIFGDVKNSENNYIDTLQPFSTFGDYNDKSEKYVEDYVSNTAHVTSDNDIGGISSPVMNVKIVETPYDEIVSVEVAEPLYISESEPQLPENKSTNESNDYSSVDNIEEKTFVIEKVTLPSDTGLTSENISDNTQLPNTDSVQISESLLHVGSNGNFEQILVDVQPEKLSEMSNSLNRFFSHELTKPFQKTVLADEIQLEDSENTSVADKTLSVEGSMNSPNFQEVLKAFETTSSTTTAIPEIPEEILDQQLFNIDDREVSQKESSSDRTSQSSSLQSSNTPDKVHNESVSAPTAIKISSYTEEVNRTTIAKTTETPVPLSVSQKSHRVSLPAEAKNIVIKLPNGQDIIIDIVPPAEASTSDTKVSSDFITEAPVSLSSCNELTSSSIDENVLGSQFSKLTDEIYTTSQDSLSPKVVATPDKPIVINKNPSKGSELHKTKNSFSGTKEILNDEVYLFAADDEVPNKIVKSSSVFSVATTTAHPVTTLFLSTSESSVLTTAIPTLSHNESSGNGAIEERTSIVSSILSTNSGNGEKESSSELLYDLETDVLTISIAKDAEEHTSASNMNENIGKFNGKISTNLDKPEEVQVEEENHSSQKKVAPVNKKDSPYYSGESLDVNLGVLNSDIGLSTLLDNIVDYGKIETIGENSGKIFHFPGNCRCICT